MITFIVNGEDVEVECSGQDTLELLVKIALTETSDMSRPVKDWQVRDMCGVVMPQNQTVERLKLDGSRLFLMPKIGAGGMTLGLKMKEIGQFTVNFMQNEETYNKETQD